MATTTSKSIRDAIVTIISGMSVVTGSKKTTMTRIRNTAQDWEGYIFRVRKRSTVNSIEVDLGTRTMTELWLIELYSIVTNLDNEALKEDRMYDYSDKVLDTFQSNTNLSGTRGVIHALVTGDNVIWQGDESLDGKPRSKWTFNLEVQRTEAC